MESPQTREPDEGCTSHCQEPFILICPFGEVVIVCRVMMQGRKDSSFCEGWLTLCLYEKMFCYAGHYHLFQGVDRRHSSVQNDIKYHFRSISVGPQKQHFD